MIRRFALAVTAALLLNPQAAQADAKLEKQFQVWLQQEVWPEAKAAGVRRKTFQAAFKGVTLKLDLPDLVIPSKKAEQQVQKQAEFGRPARYFTRQTLEYNTRVGKELRAKHSALLSRLEKQTGVPGRILLAIWGRESGFGRVAIKHDALQVLGTKGFLSTRADYFTDELIAALQLIEAGHASPRGLKSSWAGALGQPQFMPSNVMKYGADGDGNGTVDLFRSEADTLASIARYLADHGWVAGRDWGFEVKVPASLSCALEGPDQGRSIADWAALGVTRINGRAFPAHEAKGQGYLMLPSGRHGPAFLVTPNFYVLKDYNESDLYALFVGHVGDRVRYNMGDFKVGWGKTDSLLRSEVAAMQRGLEALGHDVGGADGLAGFRTRRSIGRWQEAQGQTPTCWPSKAIVRQLK
ncbi:Membrane-bound lytic murein transglycosylase B precursor [Thalassovita autumnalis]|uniref:Membrane-bound lytic murein transglycosylase B n=1 Tax=Thalassovita autumnalis TaxID=2072972 RepID=A0A0P1FWS5_9RHOB|nr:lytic murein transglycosylase [Thalassovita autumnalis]CUH73606.1 Membrane-bound lytic murein transglycosylase B precursor [Thalassovita autumnalis]